MENCLIPVFVIFSCFAGIFCMKVSGLLKYGMFERKKFIMKRKKRLTVIFLADFVKKVS